MSYSSDAKQLIRSLEVKKDCCRRNIELGSSLGMPEPVCEKDGGCFMRGVFLKCGFVSAPGRNFMLSLSPGSEEYTDFLFGYLDDIGLTPKRTVRKGKSLLYYKDSERIEDFLSYIGAGKIVLDILSGKVISDVRNQMNRLRNAETANIERATRAAAEQCEAIRYIVRIGAMHNLPAELRECAELRLENPDISLAELRLMLREPISKSGLNHRYQKIIEIAETLKSQQ